MDAQEIIENGAAHFLPNLSIDIVIIGYEKGELKTLLLRIGEKWALPGGYIGHEESVNNAADRILSMRTGLEGPHLKFFSVFGDKDRKFDHEFQQFFEEKGIPWKEDYWIFGRFVTLAYYSLVEINTTNPEPGVFDDAIGWHSFSDLPDMWLDHCKILHAARTSLQADIRSELITYNLLPEHFTMPQLHELHQTILCEKIDRSRFQKNMLASGMFERMPLLEKVTPGRKPFQYRLKENKE